MRERREDIPLLVSHFIESQNEATGKQIRGASEAAMRHLLDYPWPGNVRELENAIEHAFVVCRHTEIDTRHLPVEIRTGQRLAPKPARLRRPGRDLTPDRLTALLDECDWNNAEAARRLGISRTAVWKYMKKWRIKLSPEV